MFSCTTTSLNELIAPRSKGKVLLFLEAVDPVVCDEIDRSFSIFKRLGLGTESTEIFEDFLEHGMLAVHSEISSISKDEASRLVNYFRQEKFRNAIRATLFIDEQFIEGSGQNPSYLFDAYARFMRTETHRV